MTLEQVDRFDLRVEALQIHRHAHAIARDRPPKRIDLHRTSSPTNLYCYVLLPPGSALRPAASIPAMAQTSSLSEVSPEMPTAPRMSPPASLISTPPGLGTIRPP